LILLVEPRGIEPLTS